MPEFTIYHTNDFHGKLAPEQASKLRNLRNQISDRGLLLDAGDAGSSGNITYKADGEPILTQMSGAGYDAMTVGNRDFHFSQAGFCAKLKLASFPILCANVHTQGVGVQLPVRSQVQFTLQGGFRVTVFGLTVPMITERMLSRKVSSYIFDDPLKTAASMIPTLRSETDMLVCLSHLGLQSDRKLAETHPEIDLIVGGHTHAVLDVGEWIGRTLLVQAGSWAKLLGSVDVKWEGGNLQLSASVQEL